MKGHKIWLSTMTLGIILGVTALVPRMFDSSPAEAFTAPEGQFYMALDCDTVTAGVQDVCTFPSGTTSITVNLVLGNEAGFPTDIGSFDFEAIAAPQTVLNPPAGADANLNANPNFNDAVMATVGTWACSPPAPANDRNASPEIAESFLSCFESTGVGPALPDGSTLHAATITYNTTNGSGTIEIGFGGMGDPIGVPLVACPDVPVPDDVCFGASITIGAAAPTDTPTATHTTEAQATNTPTATHTTEAQATNTPTATHTTEAQATNTPTATHTAEAQATNTPTATHTTEAQATNTPTATNTPEGEDETPVVTQTVQVTRTAQVTRTVEVTRTVVVTPTDTPVPTSTNTPSPTNTPDDATNTPESTNTPRSTRTPGGGGGGSTSTPQSTPPAQNTPTAVSTVAGVGVSPGGGAGGSVALPDTGDGTAGSGQSWLLLALAMLVLAGGGLAGVAAYQQRRR